MYNVEFTEEAKADLRLLKKNAPNAYKKLAKIISELELHPQTGTGQCEQLKYFQEGTWSRRLDRAHRLVYRIYEENVTVLVISAFGHYKD